MNTAHTPTVKPFDPKEWIEALRSGDYNQGQSGLHFRQRGPDDKIMNYFCCLGVLCDLAVKAGVGVDVFSAADDPVDAPEGLNVSYDDREGYPPSSVVRWAGLNSDNPDVEFDSRFDTLAHLNDSGLSFSEIADVIDNNREAVFIDG